MGMELSTALSLMAIGMITVFLVLALVVITGNLLIRLINRVTPELDGISPAKVAAITAAVESFTFGKGNITNIEKH
jgi:oxaloacetate decarboxylase gamma subunit